MAKRRRGSYSYFLDVAKGKRLKLRVPSASRYARDMGTTARDPATGVDPRLVKIDRASKRLWRESQHPRHSAGSSKGGRFRKKGR